MKIIICGAGQVGWNIARHLSNERNDVTVIDTDAELTRRAADVLDVRAVTGFASHPDVLDRAGARDADLVIAATHSDEVNMVSCQVAHSVFQVPRKIARLRSPAYLEAIHSDLYRTDHLPIDVVISPEREVAQAVMQRLTTPSTFDAEVFLDGRLHLLGIALDPDCPVLNTPLRQLDEMFPTLSALVAGIRRNGRLFAPEPGDQLFEGDQVHIFTQSQDLDRTLEIFGKPPERQERVVIVGAGNVGLAVARALEALPQRIHCRLIERDRARAEEAAEILRRTVVLHGDGLSADLLDEAGIARADAIVAVTADDNTNILTGVRAKQAGARLAISLVNDPTMMPLMGALNIDAFVNPRTTTVSTILRHVRHGRVRDIYLIGDAEAEVIEAQALSTSPVSGRLVRDVEFPEGALLCAVKKGDKLLKPHGDLRIDEGDILVIFAMSRDVPEVERLLQVSIDFF